jgi:hypothetical protein
MLPPSAAVDGAGSYHGSDASLNEIPSAAPVIVPAVVAVEPRVEDSPASRRSSNNWSREQSASPIETRLRDDPPVASSPLRFGRLASNEKCDI